LAAEISLPLQEEGPAQRTGATPMQRGLRRLFRNRAAMVGLTLIVILVVMAVFAPWIAPYGYDQYGFAITEGPTAAHLFGTDDLGRDVLSRIVYGSRISLMAGLVSQTIALLIGVGLGLTAGYYGGWVDSLVMRLTDVMFAFPAVLFALVLMSVMGRTPVNLFIAIGVASWPVMARLVRSETLSVKERQFVLASRALGTNHLAIILTHILPNILSPIIVQVSFGIPQAIVAEAFLSFIGVGIPAPFPSWGLMLKDGFRWIRIHPHLTVVPGLTISLTLLAFNFLGDGLRDAFDPRTRDVGKREAGRRWQEGNGNSERREWAIREREAP
jgi:ABC-type dipeptide/oligopeptide/nickel transport system permease subunit